MTQKSKTKRGYPQECTAPDLADSIFPPKLLQKCLKCCKMEFWSGQETSGKSFPPLEKEFHDAHYYSPECRARRS